MKIYLDNDILSGLARRDYLESPDEQAAVDALPSWAAGNGHRLVTSEMARREFERTPVEETRRKIEAVFGSLSKIELQEDHELLGYAETRDQYGGFVLNPLLQDHPVARQLWDVGIKRADANHLLIAVIGECDVFLTCDRGILSRAAVVRESHAILVARPTELVAGTLEPLVDGPR